MSVSVQNQPVGLGSLDAMGLQGLSPQQATTDIQAKLTEAILQILNLLINELMKAVQQAQQQSQQGGPSSPSGSGSPQGVGGPQGASAPQGPQAPSNAYKPNDSQSPAYAAPTQTTEAHAPTKPSQVGEVSGATGGSGKAPAGMPAELWRDTQEAAQKTGIDPYLLAAQMEKESQFGKGLARSPSGGDGLMQVEPSTRQAYAGKFEQKMGHAYDHNNPKDQIAMAGVILADKGGDATNMLQKYNGGDNWTPGSSDSYQRQTQPIEYASTVIARAEQMKAAA